MNKFLKVIMLVNILTFAFMNTAFAACVPVRNATGCNPACTQGPCVQGCYGDKLGAPTCTYQPGYKP